MGYRSDFQLVVEGSLLGADIGEIQKSIEEISGYTFDCYDNELSVTQAKWYDSTDHMETLSKRYPDVRFSLRQRGEDGEQYITDAFAGDTHERSSELIFEPRTLWS